MGVELAEGGTGRICGVDGRTDNTAVAFIFLKVHNFTNILVLKKLMVLGFLFFFSDLERESFSGPANLKNHLLQRPIALNMQIYKHQFSVNIQVSFCVKLLFL